MSRKNYSIQFVSFGSLYSDSGHRKKSKIEDGGDETEGEDEDLPEESKEQGIIGGEK